jgi:hypothetical protein
VSHHLQGLRPLQRAERGTVELSTLEQFECIAFASNPLKIRNPRRPETGTKHAKSVKLTMPYQERRDQQLVAIECSELAVLDAAGNRLPRRDLGADSRTTGPSQSNSGASS